MVLINAGGGMLDLAALPGAIQSLILYTRSDARRRRLRFNDLDQRLRYANTREGSMEYYEGCRTHAPVSH